MSDWGDQLGSALLGAGEGAAMYQVAKHNPEAYVGLQKTGLIVFVVMMILFVIAGVVLFIVTKRK